MTALSLIRRYFPYDSWRRFQREIAETVYEGLLNQEIVFIEAPTGIGKTCSVLAGALAYAEETDRKIVYLIRTKSEAQAPLREIERMRARGTYLTCTVLRSRLDMCCMIENKRVPYDEFLEECRYLRYSNKCQYYVNAQKVDIEDIASRLEDMEIDIDKVSTYLCSRCLCPYEVSKKLIDHSRVIVMTYHYIFSINITENVPIELEDVILIIDEAHNLPNIIIDANSFSISELTIKACINEVKKYVSNEDRKNSALKILKNILAFMKRFKEEKSYDELERTYLQIEISDLLALFEGIEGVRDAYLEILSRKRSSGLGVPFSYLSRVLDFHKKLSMLGTQFAAFVTCNEGILEISCRCLDPAAISSRVFNKISGAVLMSGTLPPIDYMRAMLGINRPVRELRIPFREYVGSRNIIALIYPEVTTRYSERSDAMYRKIGEILSKMYREVRNGALLSVFPSYTVLKTVRRYLEPDVKYIMELSTTTISQVIERLREDRHQLIMAVAGGKLMEGVEFKINGENIVRTVIIVGVPYPEPNDFLELFREVVSTRLGSSELAWELTYLWNALMKVKQAIGRAVRSEHDRASIILMDKRYLDKRIMNILREYLGCLDVTYSIEDLVKRVREFLSD
ncbi:MAG: ATP-dependent DNA helicase [Crenarchaeota archaeon]|nr:ATP-dependent DNA helicase [Thermoproteota archaeon]